MTHQRLCSGAVGHSLRRGGEWMSGERFFTRSMKTGGDANGAAANGIWLRVGLRRSKIRPNAAANIINMIQL